MNLEDKIKDLIRLKGPIPIDEFMSIVVYYYYSNNEAFGKRGDFTTAPEISQMFGEVIGIWCANAWQNAGSPNFAIVELGPGRGTLMADVLRATKNVSSFHKSLLAINLVEASERLKELQREKLRDYEQKISWCEDILTLPKMFTIIIANEFFDALPVKQFKCEGGNIYERMVSFSGKEFKFVYLDAVPSKSAEYKEGEMFEVSLISEQYMFYVSQHLKKYGGAAIISDYGYMGGEHGDTLQALKSHKYHDLLTDIGQADLTVHVNFKALERKLRESGIATQVQTQLEFLMQNGIMLRATQLARKVGRARIESDLNRLLSPTQMGNLFKVMTAFSMPA